MGNSNSSNEGNTARNSTLNNIRYANRDLIPVGVRGQDLEGEGSQLQDYFGLDESEQTPSEVTVVKMNSAIKRESIKLIKSSQDKYYLSFKFDSSFAWTITVFFACKEVWNENHLPLHLDTLPGLPCARRYKFEKGLHQEFPPNVWSLNPTLYKESELTEAKAGFFPAILMIETIYPPEYKDKPRKSCEFTYGKFELDNDTYSFHCIKQRFLLGRKMFDLGEIYKIDGDSTSPVDNSTKLCIVWFENKEDTLALPWRHLCLWSDCSLRVRKSTNTCPYWRAKVTTFVHVKEESHLVRKATLSKKNMVTIVNELAAEEALLKETKDPGLRNSNSKAKGIDEERKYTHLDINSV